MKLEVRLKKLIEFPKDFPAAVTGVFLPDKKILVTGHTNGFVTKWRLDDESPPEVIRECSSSVETIAISNKKEVAVGCNSGLLFVFPLENPKAQTTLQDPTYDVHSRVWRTAWTGDNSLVATSTYGVINVYVRGDKGEWTTVRLSGHEHSDSIFGLDALNSAFLATGDYRGRLFVWKYHDDDYELLHKHNLLRNIEGISWDKDRAFATIDSGGGVSFFEPENGKTEWRQIFQTDTATGEGKCIAITDDGRTLFAGTENEVIQIDLGSQQMSFIGIEGVRRISSQNNLVFVLTKKSLVQFERQEISLPIEVVQYRFVKVNILGYTGVGKTSLCNLIVTGSFADAQSTWGKRIWTWDVAPGPPADRIVLFDHGGQEGVLESFLPLVSDSDIILIFFKQRDSSTFRKAEEVLEEIRPVVTQGTKIFFVQTFIDDPMKDVDEDEIQRLIESGKIADCLRVSSTSGEGVADFKARLLGEISWDKARTMIASKDVEHLTRTVVLLQRENASVVALSEIKRIYEKISGSSVSVRHLRFLLSNFSDMGVLEYYPEILKYDAVIFNDAKYNQLRTRIPLEAKQNNGIVSMRKLEALFPDRKEYVHVLDEVYVNSGISIKNHDLRIFPRSLRDGEITIPHSFRQLLKENNFEDERSFTFQEIDIGRLIKALSELNLSCIGATVGEGLFSWENNACLYYTAKESRDAVRGSLIKFSYYVGGRKKPICERLLGNFSLMIEKLYGPSINQEKQVKKKVTLETKFDVALSYASEQREYVEEVAEILQRGGIKVFYDKFQQSQLWGKDLAEYLHTVYYSRSNWCIMFISQDYVSKAWPSWERKAAMAKQVRLQKGEYVLPVRFDETEVSGLNPDLVYIDANEVPPEKLAELFLEKFEESQDSPVDSA